MHLLITEALFGDADELDVAAQLSQVGVLRAGFAALGRRVDQRFVPAVF